MPISGEARKRQLPSRTTGASKRTFSVPGTASKPSSSLSRASSGPAMTTEPSPRPVATTPVSVRCTALTLAAVRTPPARGPRRTRPERPVQLLTLGGEEDPPAANGLAFQGDKIVLSGYVSSPANGFDFGLARYTKNGQLDTSFGTGGKVETDFFGGDDAAHAVDVKGDSIVAIGDVQNGTQVVGPSTNTLYDFAAAMYDKNGKLDPKFGTGGKAVLSAGDIDSGYAGGFGPGDSVWVAGSTEDYADANTGYFAVGRWTKNGQPDPKFGTNGTTRTVIGDSSGAFGGTLGPGDTITAVGFSFPADSFTVARYTNKG